MHGDVLKLTILDAMLSKYYIIVSEEDKLNKKN